MRQWGLIPIAIFPLRCGKAEIARALSGGYTFLKRLMICFFAGRKNGFWVQVHADGGTDSKRI